jgi:hypothetical protein
LTSLRAGDQLYVRGGTYVENLGGSSANPAGATPISIYQGTSTSPILVQAYPGERPVLQGLLWLNRPSYWIVDGLNVTWNSKNLSTEHMVKMTNGVGWVFKNSELWGAHSFAAMLVVGLSSGQPSQWLLTDNCVHDTYASNGINQDHLLYINTGATAGPGIIERNILYNAPNGNAIKLAGGTTSDATVSVTVRYNTSYNSSQSVLVGGASSYNSIYGNIFTTVAGTNPIFRSYKLTGAGNVQGLNVAYGYKTFNYSDSGYLTIANGGGDLCPLDPSFDFIGQGGFHPGNLSAANFGVYAP